MTTTRRLFLVNAALLAPALAAWPARAATSERIVADTVSGLALGGHDPVEYFLARAARLGDGAHEMRWSGVIWRFRNHGNREAFAAHPEVYAPRFGGHDTVAAARNFVVAGEPSLFLILADRLYLFHAEESLQLFRSAPRGFLAQAERNWPRLLATLAR